MTSKSSWAGGTTLLAIGLALVYLGWRMLDPSVQDACAACGRPLHAHSQAVATVEGRSQTFCCPACALTEHRQSRQKVRVVELTDYETGRAVEPEETYIVRDSNLNLCMLHHVVVDDKKEARAVEFDRCSPSMIAFASRQGAARFIRQHGGVLVSFEGLARMYDTPEAP